MKEYGKVIQIKISIWLLFTFWCWNKKDWRQLIDVKKIDFDVNFVKHLESKTFQLVLFETFKKEIKKRSDKHPIKKQSWKTKDFF